MKITKVVLLLAAAIFAGACSKDDDAKPKLEDAKFSFASQSQIVKVPTSLATSEDPQAQMVYEMLTEINGFTSYSDLFTIPAGATKSSTKITAANGRVASTGDVLTYTWSDDQGNSVGYQISEKSDSYLWEIFMKIDGGDWIKFISAEEKKDKSAGALIMTDAFFGDGTGILYSYTWTHTGDNYHIVMDMPYFAYKATLDINTKTGAGSVVYLVDNSKFTMTWDANGAGSYVMFDEDGNEVDSGTWS